MAQDSSTFKATVRRSGNSTVVTIPKEIVDGLELVNGQKVTLTIWRIEKE